MWRLLGIGFIAVVVIAVALLTDGVSVEQLCKPSAASVDAST